MATIYVEAPEDVVFDSLERIVSQLVARNADLGIRHEVVLSAVGTGTQVQLTYSMPDVAWWNLAVRAVFAISNERRLREELGHIKEEAERVAASRS
jgi:hypothetical protein